MMLISEVDNLEASGKKLVKPEGFASIGRLAINLIHELNNPLDGTRRYLNLLINQISDDDPKRIYVEQIHEGLMQITRVIHGLMDLIRANSSEAKQINIKKSIEQILLNHRMSTVEQNIKVETEFDENIPDILDSNVEYIFSNIVSNAIQAMPDGGRLSVVAKMRSLRLLEIIFTDTGTGIPDEIKESIFEPFFTTRDSEKNVGLGLFISREILESYGGYMELRSELGEGSTFGINLPMYEGKILVMDDEKYMRDLISEMLSSAGYKVTSAIDGSEAVEIYRDASNLGRSYDAVILDLAVPGGMDGKAAIHRLLEIDPEVRAIVSSGYADDSIMSNFGNYGFKGALCKPYNPEELNKLLDTVIKS